MAQLSRPFSNSNLNSDASELISSVNKTDLFPVFHKNVEHLGAEESEVKKQIPVRVFQASEENGENDSLPISEENWECFRRLREEVGFEEFFAFGALHRRFCEYSLPKRKTVCDDLSVSEERGIAFVSEILSDGIGFLERKVNGFDENRKFEGDRFGDRAFSGREGKGSKTGRRWIFNRVENCDPYRSVGSLLFFLFVFLCFVSGDEREG
jgi:hypothetical protein